MKSRLAWMKGTQVPDGWVDRVLVLWTEDDALRSDPSAEHIHGAVRRIVGGGAHCNRPVSQVLGACLEVAELGDTVLRLHADGWVIGGAPDGEFLGRVAGVAPHPAEKAGPALVSKDVKDLVAIKMRMARLFVQARDIADACGLDRREIAQRMGDSTALPKILAAAIPDVTFDALARFAWACGHELQASFVKRGLDETGPDDLHRPLDCADCGEAGHARCRFDF